MSDIDKIDNYFPNLQGLSMQIWGGRWEGDDYILPQLNLQGKMQVEMLQQGSRNEAPLV